MIVLGGGQGQKSNPSTAAGLVLLDWFICPGAFSLDVCLISRHRCVCSVVIHSLQPQPPLKPKYCPPLRAERSTRLFYDSCRPYVISSWEMPSSKHTSPVESLSKFQFATALKDKLGLIKLDGRHVPHANTTFGPSAVSVSAAHLSRGSSSVPGDILLQ